ncbi:hypothetical protein [Agaribacterium sp. ZY112]|uniref:hypothetical protein n=1 Tax=Agaribacterium sp. ZY112 TaxID=3233574 RepID=UPI0035248F04
MIITLLLGFLSSCVQWFPARAQELEPGIFEVNALGNSFSSLKSLKNKVAKKALALCEQQAIEAAAQTSGLQEPDAEHLSVRLIPKKVKIDKFESYTDEIYIDGRTQSASYFSYTQTIECVAAE